MPEADTAAADDDVTSAPTENADHGAADATETHGDQPAARPTEPADKAKPDGDDTLAERDPLLLAQQDAPEPKAEPVAAKPATPPAPKPDQPPAAKPAAETPKTDTPATGEADDDDKLAVSNLPTEDWSKLSHKGKSTFLAQRKAIIASADAKKQVKELARFRDDYHTVERFVKDQGLEDEEYKNSVIVAGAIKRGDARILPFLEETVKRVRTAAGLPEPTPPAPAEPAAPPITADELAKLIDEAEQSFDFAKLRELQGKLKAPATTPAKQQPAAAKPAAAPAAPAVQPAAAPSANAPAPEEVSENMAILNALQGLGIPQGRVVEHAKGLIAELMGNGATAPPPVGERLQAVLRLHQAKASAATPDPRPQSAPLSGRRGPVTRAQPRDPNQPVDPLKHAIAR